MIVADPLERIQDLLRACRNEEAWRAAEHQTVEDPGNPHCWLLLGSALLALGRPIMSVEPLRKARALVPNNPTVAGHLYHALIQAGHRFESLSQSGSAETVYREAVALDPERTPARVCLGRLLSAAGRYLEARTQLRVILSRQPEHPDACAMLALSYEYEGDHRQAMDILERPLAKRPVAPVVALANAVLAKHTGDESAAATLLEELVATPMAESLRSDIHFALGKLYDNLCDYDRAFEHYRAGNGLLNYHYDPEQTRNTFYGITAAFSSARHPQLSRSSIKTVLPVFVVGMPRSGTTLVEQILASHPDVYGAGERNDIARIVHALGGPVSTPEGLGRLTVSALDLASQGYIDTVSRLAPAAMRIIDKMPHNFLALGYIDLLFPGCRVVHCVRDPRDTCLSIWFQQMTANHPYTNDTDALADYYRQYQALMAHWKTIIRVPLYEVRYEDLVGEIEHGARKLVEFCGLAWNEQCLHFHENVRVVSTPSYDDVRRPVHDKSVGRWRNYQRHLGALADLVDQTV